jgi:hypothetical protein
MPRGTRAVTDPSRPRHTLPFCMATILIVDDDPKIRDLLRLYV